MLSRGLPGASLGGHPPRHAALRMLKGVRKIIQIAVRHSLRPGDFAPACDRSLNFRKNLLGPLGRNLKISPDRHQGLDGRFRSSFGGHPRLQFARAVRKRVRVERRRETPQAGFGVKESMIAQVIVHVGDEIPDFRTLLFAPHSHRGKRG